MQDKIGEYREERLRWTCCQYRNFVPLSAQMLRASFMVHQYKVPRLPVSCRSTAGFACSGAGCGGVAGGNPDGLGRLPAQGDDALAHRRADAVRAREEGEGSARVVL